MSSKKKTPSDHDGDLASQLQSEELESIGAKPVKASSPADSSSFAPSSPSSSLLGGGAVHFGGGSAAGLHIDLVHKGVLARIEPKDIFAVGS